MSNNWYSIRQNTILITKSNFNDILTENGEALQFLKDSRLTGMQILIKPDQTKSKVLLAGYQRAHLENDTWHLVPVNSFSVPSEAVIGTRKLIGSVNTLLVGYKVIGYTESVGIVDCYAFAAVSPNDSKISKQIISMIEKDNGR